MAVQGSRFSRRAIGALASSLKMTGREIGLALKAREPARIGALLREGSPLEQSIDGLLYYLFVVLLFAPLVLVPAYYLFLTIAG